MKGFALGLVLKQRQKATRKWPIWRCPLSSRGGGGGAWWEGGFVIIINDQNECDRYMAAPHAEICTSTAAKSDVQTRCGWNELRLKRHPRTAD